MGKKDEAITKEEACRRLKVSPATIHNWIKQGLLEASRTGEISLLSIESLIQKIEKGEVQRLQKRANRLFLVKNPNLFEGDLFLSILFLLLFQLYHKKELISPNFSTLYDFIPLVKKTLSSKIEDFEAFFVRKAIARWIFQKIQEQKELLRNFLNSKAFTDSLFSLLEKKWLPQFEVHSLEGMGKLYQKMQQEREKVSLGAWYTPISLIKKPLRSLFQKNQQLFSQFLVDPCCGCGSFLLAAASYLDSPLNLVGIDIDEWAIWIAGVNLYLAFPHWDGALNLFCQNSLEISPHFFKKEVGLFFTNPPWGVKIENGKFSDSRITTKESFTHFLSFASSFSSEKTILFFLLPYSAFFVQKHQDFRTILQEDFDISSVSSLKRPIQGVFSEVILLEAVKRGEKKKKIEQGALNFLFWNDEESLFIRKMKKANGWNLKEHAQFGLGIVTGNNSRYLKEAKELSSEDFLLNQWRPIVCGKQLLPYRLKKELPFIRYEPDRFQQMAPLTHFSHRPKFFYRFVATHPIAALDDEGLLSLNSVNFFYLTDDSYPAEVLLLYLNSKVIRRYYRLHFCSTKVLKSALLSLPFPKASKALFDQLKKLYFEWKALDFLPTHPISDEIERLIENSYGFFQ